MRNTSLNTVEHIFVKFIDFIILVDTKARMSLKAEASKLYLSFLWWILEPLLFATAFYFVFSVLLQSRQENFLLFLMCAKVPYMWFSKAVTAASGSIVGSRGIISQIDIPKTIFPYAALQVSLYKELLVFLMLIMLCFYYGYYPQIEWLWLIPLLVLLYVMIAAFGLLTAILVSYADDFRMVISMTMLFLMFLSGIFFDIADIREPIRSYLLIFNPLAFMCDAFRKILMNKSMFDINHYFALLTFFLAVLGMLHILYKKISRNLAARVINA